MRKISFDEYSIDIDVFELRRGTQPVKIGRRALDLLLCLIRNRDRVLDRNFLQAEVWGSAELSSATIPTCILEIRRALEDDAASPRFVGSVRGRGYRFLAPIENPTGEMQPLGSKSERLDFVGRRSELKALSHLATAVSSRGSGRVALIRGEAGIGKSRLMDEFCALTSDKMLTITARCSHSEKSPPFWPWTQVLREALQEYVHDNHHLMEHAQELATVFPEILGGVEPSSLSRPSLDRFSVITRWIQTVQSITRCGPLLLHFEDIHLADADTLALLACVAEELESDPLLLIATLRPPTFSDDRIQRIAEIVNSPNALHIDLGPLSIEEIRAMLDPFEGDKETLSNALAERTAGNPFYVTTLLRYLDFRTEAIDLRDLTRKLPLNGAEIIARQLSELPRDSRDILSIASLIGDRFSIQLLSAALRISAAQVMEQLEPAIRAWVIRDNGTEYEFGHAIVRDALAQSLKGHEKRAAHKAIGNALLKHTDYKLYAGRISDHLTEALPITKHSDAYKFSIVAARESAARFAFSKAVQYYRRALTIQNDDPEAAPLSKCATMNELALSLLYAGERTEARAILLTAANIARDSASPKMLAKCALLLAPDFLSIEVGVVDEALIGLLEEALGSLSDCDGAYRSILLARLSQANQWTHRADHAEHLSRLALRAARDSEDAEALLAALTACAESTHGPLLAEARLAFIDELGDVARRAANIPARLLHHTRSITAHLELGEIEKVASENEKYRTLATETNLPQYRWYPKAHDSMLAMLHGNIREAEQLAAEFRAIAGHSADQNCLQTFACHSLLRAVELDEASNMLPMLEKAATDQTNMYVWSAAIPWFYCEAGLPELALGAIARFQKEQILEMSREPGGGIGLALLAEASALLDHHSIAEFLYTLVAPIEDRCATVGYGVAYFGSFARYAGLLANSLGDKEQAALHMEFACEQEKQRGAISWRAYAEADLAAIKREAGNDRDDIATRLRSASVTIDPSSLPRAFRKIQETLVLLDR